MNDGKRSCYNQKNVALHQTLNNLAIDSDVKVCKFDKGKVVAILDTKDYYDKLNCIISDNSKFHKVDQNTKIHSIIRKKKSISYYLKKYLHCFDSEITKKLVPKGSNSGKIYDLIKVHKNSNPARPVVSMIGTPEYKLANFFDSIIKSYLFDNHMLYSTEDFPEKLN